MLLTGSTIAGLKFLARMRLITIAQFACASGLSVRHAGEFLHSQKLKRFLGQSGGVPLAGQGRAPKVYYFTRKGWMHYTDSENIDLGPFRDARPRAAWSQSMPHRLQTVSIYQALQGALCQTLMGSVPFARFDFRTGEFIGRRCKETMDFVSAACDLNSRIIPDATFCLERHDQRRALAFLECDMGTETLSKQVTDKFEKYCAYYHSGRFVDRYSDWGEFQSFMVLFVTNSPTRLDALRVQRMNMPSDLSRLFLLATHDEVLAHPLDPVWRSMGAEREAPVSIMGNR